MSIKLFVTGYSSPIMDRNLMRGADVAKDTPGVGMDPAFTESHLIGKVDQQLGLPILCANNGGGMRQRKLRRSELEELAADNSGALMARVKADIEGISDLIQRVDYCGTVCSAIRGNPNVLDVVHALSIYIAEAVDGLSNCDWRDVGGLRFEGNLYNICALHLRYAQKYEKRNFGTIDADCSEKIADIRFFFARYGDPHMHKLREGYETSDPPEVAVSIAVMALDVIHRYGVLGLENKVELVQAYLRELYQVYPLLSQDVRELLAASIGNVSGWAALIIECQNDEGFVSNISRNLGGLGYSQAEWYFNEIANELEQQKKGKPYVQYYRDEAVKAHRIGVALGLIEE